MVGAEPRAPVPSCAAAARPRRPAPPRSPAPGGARCALRAAGSPCWRTRARAPRRGASNPEEQPQTQGGRRSHVTAAQAPQLQPGDPRLRPPASFAPEEPSSSSSSSKCQISSPLSVPERLRTKCTPIRAPRSVTPKESFHVPRHSPNAFVCARAPAPRPASALPLGRSVKPGALEAAQVLNRPFVLSRCRTSCQWDFLSLLSHRDAGAEALTPLWVPDFLLALEERKSELL